MCSQYLRLRERATINTLWKRGGSSGRTKGVEGSDMFTSLRTRS